MRTMTLNQKIAQLVIVPFYGDAPSARSKEYRQLARLVRDVRVGGLILINRTRNRAFRRAEPYALAAFLNRMQRLAAVPLLVGSDFERGASMRVDSTTLFPHAMAFGAGGDLEATRFAGLTTAREARALGVQWIMVPVADVNNNPDNPVIGIRSYGEDPKMVAAHVRAFIEGARGDSNARVLTNAKHFPGHGDTAVDTHLNLAVIPADRARLEAVELVPFREAIAAGTDVVMTAHIAVPALDQPDVPATLSRAIVTGLLRDQLGFEGLISTDALEMGGIAKGFGVGEAAVRAIEAGNDVLLMPPDPDAAIRAVAAAVKSGRISRKRIDESVERVLGAKVRVGLDRKRLVDVEAVEDAIDSPDAAERAQRIADRAVTLVRNDGAILPLKKKPDACFVAMIENRYSPQSHALVDEIRARIPGAPVTVIDPSMREDEQEQAARQGADCKDPVVFVYAAVTSNRGAYARILTNLSANGRRLALVSLGNPYLIRDLPNVSAYLTTFSTVAPSEIAAVKAVFGEIPLVGRLPVTIPGIAAIGAGLTLPAQ